jgi:hypothetical protein
LNDSLIYGDPAVESGAAADDTVSADHPSFDPMSVGKTNNEGDDSSRGEVNAVNLFLRTEQNRAKSESVLP